MEKLVVIPARAGSKGIPNKNIKLLKGKPLIQYSIEVAKKIAEDSDICVSTDSPEIAEVVESLGLKIPFLRPSALASDTAGSRGVLLHALDHYLKQGRKYEAIILLQPTSPFRRVADIQKMIEMFSPDLDMVVSVREAHDNPYFSLFEENARGYLELSKNGSYVRRQDCPKVYAYNGSVYIININTIQQKEINQFSRIRKYVMDDITSVDIDSPLDWWTAELILEKSVWETSEFE